MANSFASSAQRLLKDMIQEHSQQPAMPNHHDIPVSPALRRVLQRLQCPFKQLTSALSEGHRKIGV